MRYEVYENQKRYGELYYGYANTLEEAILLGEEEGLGCDFFVELDGEIVYRNY